MDGEIVTIDEFGKPSFHALQNNGSSKVPLFYYVFDLLILAGRDLTNEPLSLRRQLLDRHVLPNLDDPVRESAVLDANLLDLIHAVKAQGLEGLVAKRKDSRYESGQRSGAWQKMRVNQGQEFVIGATHARRVHSMRSSSAYYEGGSSYTWRAPATGSRHLHENGCSSILRGWRSASVPLGTSPNRGAGVGGKDLRLRRWKNVCG